MNTSHIGAICIGDTPGLPSSSLVTGISYTCNSSRKLRYMYRLVFKNKVDFIYCLLGSDYEHLGYMIIYVIICR